MSKIKAIKCLLCGKKYTNIHKLHGHIEKIHNENIPDGFSPSRYYYMLRTSKDHGNCVVCRENTDWNESTYKYKRFCNNEKCKKMYVDSFKKRMINKYGETTLLRDPEHQRKMLANRKISGKYTWSDGSVKTYTGQYELDFLKFLDSFMEFDSNDIFTPSPHTYEYNYKGEKKFYIPDVYIASLSLELEIKASDNMHHKIQAVDKVKEQLKDEVMESLKEVNYFKVFDKKYDNFVDYLIGLKTDINKSELRDEGVINMKEDVTNFDIDMDMNQLLEFSQGVNNKLDKDLNVLNELTTYDADFSKKTEPIYVVLVSSRGFSSDIIRKFTGSYYSHSALALDTDFNNLYSFNTGASGGGFFVETLYGPLYNDLDYFTVYVLFVTKEIKNKMRANLKKFIENQVRYKYNFFGLVKFALGMKDKGTKSIEDKVFFFCSEFVMYMIKECVPEFKNILVAPQEFLTLSGFKQLKTYTVPTYNPKEVAQLTKYARQELMMVNKGVKEFALPFGKKAAAQKEIDQLKEDFRNYINWKHVYDAFRITFPENRNDMKLYFAMVDMIMNKKIFGMTRNNAETIIKKEFNIINYMIGQNEKIFRIEKIEGNKNLIYVKYDGTNTVSKVEYNIDKYNV